MLSGVGRKVGAVLDSTRPPPRPPFRSLRSRLAGQPADDGLHEDAPPHLEAALRQWLADAEGLDLNSTPPLDVRVCLRLGLLPAPPTRGRGGLSALLYVDFLEVTDAALDQLDPSVTLHGDLLQYPEGSNGEHARLLIQRLDHILDLGRSAYRVAENGRQLEPRVDPTVTAAFEHTLAAAGPSAADLLRTAWNAVYTRHPDPSTAYRQAVRAVEEVACPRVLPTDEDRTLGKVIAHLKQGGHKWRFVLVDRAGADTVEPLVGMLDRLWTGQVSRHGGAKKSRDQTQPEAEAAVHLAATLVQLLATGALARRDTP
jgi:hypothetical protein